MKSQHTPQGTPAIQHSEQPFFSKTQVQKKPFFTPEKVQEKLTVGQPGDKYEQEADAVADHVVSRMSQSSQPPAVQAQCPCEDEGSVQKKPDIMKQEGMEEEETVQMQPMEEEEETMQMQPMEEEEEMMQPKLRESTIQRAGQVRDAFDQERELQMKSDSPMTAGKDLEQQLSTAKGGGSSLPANVQTQMESAIGADFGGVKVHTGSDAQQMNQDLNAQAFTHGKDIFFNEGKYDPSSTQGQHLLAHELTHVVQQTGEE